MKIQNNNYDYYSNATEILPGLWLGNIKSSLDTTFFNDKQIKCVINCTKQYPFCDDPLIEIKYRLPIKNDNDIDEIEKFYNLLDAAVDQIKNNIRSYNILVHCYDGKHRAVAVIIAYLIKYGQINLQSAIDAIKSKKPDVLDPELNFDVVLQAYQKQIIDNTNDIIQTI